MLTTAFKEKLSYRELIKTNVQVQEVFSVEQSDENKPEDSEASCKIM